MDVKVSIDFDGMSVGELLELREQIDAALAKKGQDVVQEVPVENVVRPDEWVDNGDSYYCPRCLFETGNPNYLEGRGVYCPRCRKQLRWNIPGEMDG